MCTHLSVPAVCEGAFLKGRQSLSVLWKSAWPFSKLSVKTEEVGIGWYERGIEMAVGSLTPFVVPLWSDVEAAHITVATLNVAAPPPQKKKKKNPRDCALPFNGKN